MADIDAIRLRSADRSREIHRPPATGKPGTGNETPKRLEFRRQSQICGVCGFSGSPATRLPAVQWLPMRYVYAVVACSLTAVLGAQDQQSQKDDKQLERQQWFYSQRVYPRTSIPPGARLNAIRQIERNDASSRSRHVQAAAAGVPTPALALDSANWTLIGPRPTGGGTSSITSGRINAIAIDPRDNNVVYIGAAEGGVWKTTDGGQNWTPLTDDQPSLANGAIAIDPLQPDTVYVGTGEENFAGDSYYGIGILKSTDGGRTWTNTVGPFLRDKIGAIAIEPGNSKVLLCTSTSGVWRSADAGATWINVLTGAAGTSVVFDPTNGNSVYAALGSIGGSTRNGVYHSTNGGLSWSTVTQSGSLGLPTTNVGRIEIAMAPSNPATIYVQIQDAGTNFGNLLGIYKTTDGGTTWNQLSIPNVTIWGPQLWYDNTIRVHPSNPDIVWSGALNIYRSLDGGKTWATLPSIGPNGQGTHVDYHYLAFTPDGSKLYIGNDGGIFSTPNISTSSVNWTSLNTTLAITQFYPGVSIHPSNAQIGLGGTQDNSTERYTGTQIWQSVACGDGGFTAIDPAFPSLAYSACQDISIARTGDLSTSVWVSATYGIDQTDLTQFISPFVIDAANPQTLYFGTYRLWQSRDSAGRWNAVSPDLTGGKKGSLKSIAIAPSNRNIVYVGTSNSKVQATFDMQNGAQSTWSDRSAGLPSRVITHVAVDPVDPGLVYVTFSGFPTGTDTQGHVFRSSDSGATWADISGNMPSIPVNDLAIDPDLPQTLYIGTDAGVMVTTDGGATWSTLGKGLPRVVVNSLVLHRRSRVLRAATHGRSVWDILVPIGTTLEPQISTLTPNKANVGDGTLAVQVAGTNFTGRTIMRWNGQDRTTTVTDSAHVTMQIPASDLAVAGRAAVTAFNAGSGGGPSTPAPFTIGGPPVSSSAAAVSAANPLGGNNLGLRSIASIYGVNLSATTASADLGPPLPSTLGGTTLTIPGVNVPLFFVSPTQINFQVPFITTGPQELTITQGAQSTTITVTLSNYAPALFTMNEAGSGQAAALVIPTASIAAPVGMFPNSRPVQVGESVSIYCTGLGDVSNRPALGAASPGNPLARSLVDPLVNIGGFIAPVAFSGLAPGYVGLYQVNAQVPAGVTPGPAVEMFMTIGGIKSNIATIAVDPAH
jgi:uncharacterized protein (TIGR03437 family)